MPVCKALCSPQLDDKMKENLHQIPTPCRHIFGLEKKNERKNGKTRKRFVHENLNEN